MQQAGQRHGSAPALSSEGRYPEGHGQARKTQRRGPRHDQPLESDGTLLTAAGLLARLPLATQRDADTEHRAQAQFDEFWRECASGPKAVRAFLVDPTTTLRPLREPRLAARARRTQAADHARDRARRQAPGQRRPCAASEWSSWRG